VIGAITAGLYGTGVPPVTNSYESIATYVVGSGGVSTVTFSSIPSTFKHLQLRTMWKLSSGTNLIANFNGSGAGNYKTHILFGDGSSAYAGVSSVSPNAIGLGYAGASTISATVADILDYTDTNKNTTVRYLMGDDRNGAGDVEFGSGLWLNTAAINQIVIAGQSGATIQEFSHFALYGIKG
jgi:hypothetical protein